MWPGLSASFGRWFGRPEGGWSHPRWRGEVQLDVVLRLPLGSRLAPHWVRIDNFCNRRWRYTLLILRNIRSSQNRAPGGRTGSSKTYGIEVTGRMYNCVCVFVVRRENSAEAIEETRREWDMLEIWVKTWNFQTNKYSREGKEKKRPGKKLKKGIIDDPSDWERAICRSLNIVNDIDDTSDVRIFDLWYLIAVGDRGWRSRGCGWAWIGLDQRENVRFCFARRRNVHSEDEDWWNCDGEAE
ncbi:hypothetical protein C8R43DRAFT_962072 [Mycena crocata]|nr:hypothetical protein C8R43DRAFT_962072 [Mycena crocata]